MRKYKKILTRLKCYLRRISQLNASPRIIALSFAIGSFIAIIPLFGFGILIGLSVIFIFKKLNKIALMSAFIIWNPLILAPIITFSYKLGDIIFSGVEIVKYEMMFLNHFFTFTRRFLVGNMIIDFSLSLISFVVVYFLVLFYRKKQFKRSQVKVITSESSFENIIKECKSESDITMKVQNTQEELPV